MKTIISTSIHLSIFLSLFLSIALITSCSEASNPSQPEDLAENTQTAVPLSSVVPMSSSSIQPISSSAAPITQASMDSLNLYYTDTVRSENGDFFTRYTHKIGIDLDSLLHNGQLDSATHARHTDWFSKTSCDTYMNYLDTINSERYRYCRNGPSRETVPTESGIYIREINWEYGCQIGESKYYTESDTLYTHYVRPEYDCRRTKVHSSYRVLNNTDTVFQQDSTSSTIQVEGTLKIARGYVKHSFGPNTLETLWEFDLVSQDTITLTPYADRAFSWNTQDSIRHFEYRMDSNSVAQYQVNLLTNDTIHYEKKVNGKKEGIVYYFDSELTYLYADVSPKVYETYSQGTLNGKRWVSMVNNEYYFEEHYSNGLLDGESWHSRIGIDGSWKKTHYTYTSGVKDGPYLETIDGDTIQWGTYANALKNGLIYKQEKDIYGITYQYLTNYLSHKKNGSECIMNTSGDTLRYQYNENDSLVGPLIASTDGEPTINTARITAATQDTISYWTLADTSYTLNRYKIRKKDTLFAYNLTGYMQPGDHPTIHGKGIMIETGIIDDIYIFGNLSRSIKYTGTILSAQYDSLDRIKRISYLHPSYYDPDSPIVNSFYALLDSNSNVTSISNQTKQVNGYPSSTEICNTIASCAVQDHYYWYIIDDAKKLTFIDPSVIQFSEEWNKVISWSP